MNDRVAPDIRIQCEYGSLDELVVNLNNVLLNKEVVIVEHTLDGHGADLMLPRYGAMVRPAEIDMRHCRSGDANIVIPVGDNHGIIIPNNPVVHNGKDYPSGIDLHGDHVKIRYVQLRDTYAGHLPVKSYFTITAFRALND